MALEIGLPIFVGDEFPSSFLWGSQQDPRACARMLVTRTTFSIRVKKLHVGTLRMPIWSIHPPSENGSLNCNGNYFRAKS